MEIFFAIFFKLLFLFWFQYMQINKIVQIQEELPTTHFFTYNGKNYQINFDFFKYYSKYFSNHQLEIQAKQYIPLLNEDQNKDIRLSEESIQYFINFIHRQQITLTNENVIHLNYLANKYEVPLLINATNDYISSNHSALALQLLLLYQNDPKCQPEQYEDIISKKFLDFINDDRLFSLNISNLHRIIEKYLIEHENDPISENDDKIMNFLFKCLDGEKFGLSASCFFEHVNFSGGRSKYLNVLVNDYDNKFDFHFINSNFLKSIYLTQSQLFQMDDKNQLKYDELVKKFEKEIDDLKAENTRRLDEQKKAFDDEIKSVKSENDDLRRKVQLLSEQLQKFGDEMEKLKSEINEANEESSKEQNELIQKEEQNRQKNEELASLMERRFNEMRAEQARKLEEQKRNVDEKIGNATKEIEELKNSQFDKPIFNQLKLLSYGNIIDSGVIGYETSHIDDGKIQNLFDNSQRTYFRIDEKDGYIIFDFKDRKVQFSKYYFSVPIKRLGICYGRPKSWKIEASNDKNTWDLVDLRENDTNLNNYGLFNTYACNNIPNDFYRYIRIQEIISQDSNHKFLLSEIEFYGSIK